MAPTETACPLCDGTGWKIIKRGGLSGAERCACYPATLNRELKERASIPSNFRTKSLDNFNLPNGDRMTHDALSQVRRDVTSFIKYFPEKDKPGLLLVGDPGSGKTHLAVAALRELIDKGHECLFFDYQNLLDRIRSGYNEASGAADREVYQDVLDVEVLLIDDLGAQRVTEWVLDTVTSIITLRCNNEKPLIATTNLTDEERGKEMAMGGGEKKDIRGRTLAEMIGLRAHSRLFEMCRIVRLPPIDDYRKKRA